jgi:DNA repair protein RadC
MTTVSVSSIFKPVLLSNAVNMILVHNHPCSTMSPSQADINLTKKVEKIADQLEITLFDHIIVNVDCSEFYSLKTQGLL